VIRVAFASDDHESVNLHFGAAEQFIIYDVEPGAAHLVGVGQFAKVRMKGVNAEGDAGAPPQVEDEEKMSEDKVIAKIDFLRSCAGVYAAKVGASSIKRLMQADIQPIIVNRGFPIVELLNEVSLALVCGGLAWVDHAKSRPKELSASLVAQTSSVGTHDTYELITSIDGLD
jgi:nitrogen fixation protein NifX